MNAIAIKAASVLLAFSFSGIVILLIRRCFGGWASDSAMGRGACLSLLTIGLSVLLPMVAEAIVATATPQDWSVWSDAFIVAGLCEETARYVALLILLRGALTSDPREFVAGAAAIGLGFGVIENLFYLSGAASYLTLGALRGVLSAPAHLSFTFLSAYGLWSIARRGKSLFFAAGFFLLAVLLHGAFDVSVMSWPDIDKTMPKDVSALRLAGVGFAIFATIITTTVATLLIFSEFLAWADDVSSHDQRVETQLSPHWRALALTLRRLALALIFTPVAAAFMAKVSTGVLYAPLLIGAAGSLALRSVAIFQLAD